jgi:tripartite-type tricarboxylate transporter receptor subunit TctC
MNILGACTMRMLALIVLLFAFSASSWPQSYPVKPIRFVVANSPGSNADFLARILASPLSGVLGQQVYVDNRPGAGTTIGTEFAARALPDGYTLLNVNMPAAVNETLYPNRNYSLIRDFAPPRRNPV